MDILLSIVWLIIATIVVSVGITLFIGACILLMHLFMNLFNYGLTLFNLYVII